MTSEQFAGHLDTMRAQVEALAVNLTQSQTETADLRTATDLALTTMQESLDKASLRTTSGQGADGPGFMRLMDEKVNRPPTFDGNRKDVRGWSRPVKVYLDSKYPGFRKMLTVIERAEGMSNDFDLQQSGWKWALVAKKSFYNMLIS